MAGLGNPRLGAPATRIVVSFSFRPPLKGNANITSLPGAPGPAGPSLAMAMAPSKIFASWGPVTETYPLSPLVRVQPSGRPTEAVLSAVVAVVSLTGLAGALVWAETSELSGPPKPSAAMTRAVTGWLR